MNLILKLLWSQLVDPTYPGHPLWSISPSGTLWSPSRALYIPISLPNQLRSLWNLKLKLLGSQLVDPTYPGHPLWSISPSGAPLEPSISLYLCQMNSDLHETWNLSLWGPNWLIPLILAIPSVLSAPSGTLWSPSRALYILISLPNQLGSLWNLNLNLFGSQLVDPTYPGHPLCSIITLWIPLYPYDSAKSTQIFMKLETWAPWVPNGWPHLSWPSPLFYQYHLEPSGTLWNPSEPSGALYIPITQPNQHWSLWNLKHKLQGFLLVDPTYPGHPLCSISTPWITLV